MSLGDHTATVNEESPHYILYFDVNKTLVMHDPVQGKDLHNILNDLITERAYGNVSNDGNIWVWNGKEEDILTFNIVHTELNEVSFGDYLRSKYPLSSDREESKKNKLIRKQMRQDFTSKGYPGELLAPIHAKLLNKLALPELEDDNLEILRKKAGLHCTDHYFIVPSFYRFIQYLYEKNIKFNLIFRTYGDDIDRIAQEFNCFCEGSHPYFKLDSIMDNTPATLDGRNNTVDRRLHLHLDQGDCSNSLMLDSGVQIPRFGTFYRSKSMTALIMGTLDQPKENEDSTTGLEFFNSYTDIHIVKGLKNIHTFLTKTFQYQQSTLAIRDFYEYWFHSKQSDTCGKLMPVNACNSSTANVYEMFFDDNILQDRAHIVDVRSINPTIDTNVGDEEGVPVAFDCAKNCYLLPVEPLQVIQDENYFINCFELATQKHKLKNE